MTHSQFRYVLHISASCERVWAALTENAHWQQYWDEWQIESDWQVGGKVTFHTADGQFFSSGEVLDAQAPHRLKYSWPNPPAEQGDAPIEQLMWELAESGPGTTRLQFTHSNLGDVVYKGVSEGWPAILSSLKTLLETGAPLKFNQT